MSATSRALDERDALKAAVAQLREALLMLEIHRNTELNMVWVHGAAVAVHEIERVLAATAPREEP